MSVFNRVIITQRQTIKDSTQYFKLKYDSSISLNDSLNNELFIQKTINGRYELSLDFLERVNSKGATQFKNYLMTQTE
jgi:hypothetical protein